MLYLPSQLRTRKTRATVASVGEPRTGEATPQLPDWYQSCMGYMSLQHPMQSPLVYPTYPWPHGKENWQLPPPYCGGQGNWYVLKFEAHCTQMDGLPGSQTWAESVEPSPGKSATASKTSAAPGQFSLGHGNHGV